jgi:hypothetical protein
MCKITQQVGRCKCGQSTSLDELRAKIRCETNRRRIEYGTCSEKRSELWTGKWILHNDNAPAHDKIRVRHFLAKKFVTKMDHNRTNLI